jgi:hypothetical protein
VAQAAPTYLKCTVPFQQKDGRITERNFEISVDPADKTGSAREINAPYQFGGGQPHAPKFEPDWVTFVMSRFGGITEAITVSRTDLSIHFLLGTNGSALRPASMKGKCTKIEPPRREF